MFMQRYLRPVAYLAVSFATVGSNASAQRTSAPNAATFVVVVNAANSITTIERDELSNIFLKRRVTWPGGDPADPIDLAVTEPSRIDFSKAVHKKPVGAVRAFWQQQIFSGRDVPPAEKASEDEVVSYVKEHVAAVGYVSATVDLPLGVKALDVRGAKQ